MEALLNDIP